MPLTIGRLPIDSPLGSQEQVGDPVGTLGAATVPGQRSPLQAALQIATFTGNLSADAVTDRMRVRRQLRGMLNNTPLKLRGIYVAWDEDSEANGWYVPDRMTIADGADQSSLATGFFKADGNWNLVGRQRTHRRAMAFGVKDLRLSTNYRDFQKQIYATDFASLSSLVLGYLPDSASDVINAVSGTVLTVQSTRVGRDGTSPVAPGLVDLTVVSFEQPEGARHKMDCVVYDRRATLNTTGNNYNGFPAYTNYVREPSFEAPLVNWTNSGSYVSAGATLTRDATTAGVGTTSLKVVCGAVSNHGANYSDPSSTPFPVNTTVQVSVLLRGNSGGEVVELHSFFGGANDPATMSVTLTTAWTRYTISIVATAARTGFAVGVRHPAASAATFFIDAVAFVPISLAPPAGTQSFLDPLTSDTTGSYTTFGGSSALSFANPGIKATNPTGSPNIFFFSNGPQIAGDAGVLVKFTTENSISAGASHGALLVHDANNYIRAFYYGSTSGFYISSTVGGVDQGYAATNTGQPGQSINLQSNSTYWFRLDRCGTLVYVALYNVDPAAGGQPIVSWLAAVAGAQAIGTVAPGVWMNWSAQTPGGIVQSITGYSDVDTLRVPYFDGSQPGCAWNGPAHNSTSTGRWGSINLVPNPNFETGDRTPWQNATAAFTTFAVQSGWAGAGTNALRCTGYLAINGSATAEAVVRGTSAIPVIPGEWYTWQTRLNVLALPQASGFGFYPEIIWHDAAGGTVSAIDGPRTAVPGIQTETLTAQAPPNARYATPIVFFAMPSTAGGLLDFYVDGAGFYLGQTAPTFFDGDTPRAGWLGTRGNSSSQLFDPESQFGWEEVYGPDQPLTAGDVPVIANGFCRVRYAPAPSSGSAGFRVDAWQSAGGWVEQGMIAIKRRSNSSNAFMTNLVSAQVLEWTPDRVVVMAVMYVVGDLPNSRERVYLTLQRGWTGPRVEVYPALRADGSKAGSAVYFYSAYGDLNASALKIDASASGSSFSASAGPGFIPATDLGASTFTGENELALLREASSPWQVTLAVLQAGLTGASAADTNGYGVARNAIQVYDPSSNLGYLSAQLGFAPQVTAQTAEAESLQLGSGTTVGADGAASGGSTTSSGRTSDAIHVSLPGLSASGLVSYAKYRIFVRVKVSAGTGSFYALGATTGATKTTTSTSYVWLDLGDIVAYPSSGSIDIHAWITSGTVYVDRVESFKLEDRTNGPYDGARDFGQAILTDVRELQTLVTR